MSLDITREVQSCGTKRKREVGTNRRTRTSLACDTCRKQKEKCEGGHPCWRCQRLNRRCQFSSHTAPQSSRCPLQSDMLSSSPDNEYSYQENLECIAQHFLGDVPLNEENVSRMAAKCRDRSEGENSLDVNEESFDVHFVSRDVAFYSGEFSHWNFSAKLRSLVDQSSSSHRTVRSHRGALNPGVKEYWRPTHLQSSIHVVTEAVSHLPPRPIAEFLASVFYKYTEVNNFYAERSWVQDKLSLCYESTTELTSSDIPWVCSIFALLGVGTQMAHMEEDRGNPDSTPEEIAACSEDSVGLLFYRVACGLVPDVLLAASYESVQAFLLLAAYALPVSTSGLAYTYLGMGMKMAILNGMHRKYTGSHCDARTLELRNRLFWTVYTLERRISIMHGRPNSISRSEVSADLPTNSPEFDSPQYENMMAFIDLVSWTADVAEELTKFKRSPRRLVAEHSHRLGQLKARITDWWNSLPASTACRDISPQGPLFRQNCHLKLCYLTIFIYMGRPFIFNSRAQEARSDDNSTQKTKEVSKLQRSELVNDCIQTALDILTTLQSLATNVGLCRASYTEFSSARAALLVILAESLNSGMSTELQDGLNRGMKLIRQMVGGTSSQSEISYIESIEAAIRQLASNPEPGNQESTTQSSTSAYAKFKDWTQSMKRDKGFGSTVELSSFSPMSNLTSVAEGSFNSDIHDLGDLLNTDWATEDLNLNPEMFLATEEFQ